jgi:hypothetical protein
MRARLPTQPPTDRYVPISPARRLERATLDPWMKGRSFDAWLREVTPESFEDGAFIPDTWLRWLRQVYDAHGALSRQYLEARAAQDVMAVADLALDTVLAEVDRVLGTDLEWSSLTRTASE